MQFYDILSARRKALGMSIDSLVESSGVPKGTVTKVLTGVIKNPGIESLKAITYALGLTLEDLNGDSKQPTDAGELLDSEVRFMEFYNRLDADGLDLVDAYLDLPQDRRHMLAVTARALLQDLKPPAVPRQ